jgi:hypothetical protein
MASETPCVCSLVSYSASGINLLQDDDSDAEHEHAHLAWRVGWPRDTERAAAALWVLWFFEGEGELLFCFGEHVPGWLLFLFLEILGGDLDFR